MSMEKMKRMQSRKSHSWWWDSHISRKNSKWLAESLAEMDRSVKEMLKLIEEDGDSFAKKAEMYYAKRPELVSHVEDFYRMYRALAERYDQVTGDLRKKIKSERKSQNLAAESDIVSEISSPAALESSEITPISHSRHAMLTSRAAGFNFFLGSDGNSDHSKKSKDDSFSSSSSSSESDVDDLSETNVDCDSSKLHQRIFELENELSEVKEKLKIQEDKCYHEHNSPKENGNNHLDTEAKVSELEEQLSDANIKLNYSESQISDLQKKLEETTASFMAENAELSLEKEKVYKLEEQIALLQDEISGHNQEIEQLKGAAEVATLELQSYLTQRNDQIEQCKNELIFAKEKYLQEKSSFESDSSMLHQRIFELENELNNHLNLQAKVLELEEQLSDANIKLNVSETQISDLQKKLEESTASLVAKNADLSLEKEKVYKLEEQIALLQDEISCHKQEIEQLKGTAEAATIELHNYLTQSNDEIEQCKNELNGAKEKYLLEKSTLETRVLDLEDLNAVLHEEVDKYKKDMSSLKVQILELEDVVHDLKVSGSSSMEKLIQEKSTLEADISFLSQSNASLKADVKTLTGQMKQFESDRHAAMEEHVKYINELNQTLDALKLNVDTLAAEKLELLAKLSALLNDLKSRDDKICKMDQHLNRLHLEHVKMITDMEASRRSNSELQVRVKELEEEVEKQKTAISECAEAKREVIRQLCFSLEHYRDGYDHLRQLLQGHKRTAIMAS